MCHKVGLIGVRCGLDKVNKALDHHRYEIARIGLILVQVLLHKVVDLTVQALRHNGSPRFTVRAALLDGWSLTGTPK
jgi:hypothetical protein